MPILASALADTKSLEEEEVKMFRSLLSRRSLISICLVLFTVMAETWVPGTRDVLAAVPATNAGHQTTNVYYTTAFSSGAPELWAIKVTGRKIAQPTSDR